MTSADILDLVDEIALALTDNDKDALLSPDMALSLTARIRAAKTVIGVAPGYATSRPPDFNTLGRDWYIDGWSMA